MKKTIIACLSAMTISAFAAQNDLLVTFSSNGPDKYADGAVVLDGECYALVWTKSGASFEGLSADGLAVGENSEVILVAPVAKDGHCPTIVFEVSAEKAESLGDGTFGVYLLDTRLANGKTGGVKSSGIPVAVNGYGAVGSVVSKTSLTGPASLEVAETASVSVKSQDPASAPKPVIKTMKVVGGNVYLTVSGTLPCMQYNVSAGDSPSAISDKNISVPQNGKSEDDIIFVAPATGSSRFFKINRQ